MSFLSSLASTVGKSAATSYKQLQGPTGVRQSASDTIDKLCDRLANGTLAEDRRAALMGLKGMSRDWKGVGCSDSIRGSFNQSMDGWISQRDGNDGG